MLSIDSMAGFAAFGLGAPLLGALADVADLQVAMVAAGSFAAFGAVFYRAALRAEQARPSRRPPRAETPLVPG